MCVCFLCTNIYGYGKPACLIGNLVTHRTKWDKDEKGEDKDNNEEEKNGAAGEEGEDGEEEEDRSELLPAACFLWWTGFDSVSLKRCHFVVGGKCMEVYFLNVLAF